MANISLNRLTVLITVVRRKKTEYYTDLIQSLGANLQFRAYAEGTAADHLMEYLGLADREMSVIVSLIKADAAGQILGTLEERFASIRDGKGIAFTVPMTSMIGARMFAFLCDNRDVIREGNDGGI